MISNRPTGIYEENEEFRYTADFIKRAREKIKEFCCISRIVEDFSEANQDNYDYNQILLLAANANPSDNKEKKAAEASPEIINRMLVFLDDKGKRDSEEELRNFNCVIHRLLNHSNLEPEQEESIKSKLKSFKSNQNYPLIIELRLYVDLIKRGVSNIEYQNRNRGNHDFYFKIDEEEFNLELTTLFWEVYPKKFK